jgi:hypothetical protein
LRVEPEIYAARKQRAQGPVMVLEIRNLEFIGVELFGELNHLLNLRFCRVVSRLWVAAVKNLLAALQEMWEPKPQSATIGTRTKLVWPAIMPMRGGFGWSPSNFQSCCIDDLLQSISLPLFHARLGCLPHATFIR